jgi:lipopolysaccharide transport system ATP-binding protein
MSEIVIKAENLGKKYTIGHQADRTSYVSFRDVLMRNASNLWVKTKDLAQGKPLIMGDATEEFWALRDLNFEIQRGEAVGIIGRNGAGKSTLLKVLSRITELSAGRVTIRGRITSLLEVGTGFHPELSGRENIFLNGAVLGMRRAEIKGKFDEIVAFAEVDKFLDTPVKRYSSGMYVRLAFAVAAHLEPEILVVDEVLAVGDAGFQKKCLGKMADVAQEGRTVLFVSHNMGSVQRLCRRVILLDSGRLEMDGQSKEVIRSYVCSTNRGEESFSQRECDIASAPGDEYVRLMQVSLVAADGSTNSGFNMDEQFTIRIKYNILQLISDFHLYIRVHTEDGVLAFCSGDWDNGELQQSHQDPGRYIMNVTIPKYFLNAGVYTLTLVGFVANIRVVFEESPIVIWRIHPVGGAGGFHSLNRQGVFRPMLEWTQKTI